MVFRPFQDLCRGRFPEPKSPRQLQNQEPPGAKMFTCSVYLRGSYIIPPMPPAPPGIAGVSSLMLATTDSVVSRVDATLVAF